MFDDMRVGLVRVTMRDASVWWVKPDLVDTYRRMDTAGLPGVDVTVARATGTAYWKALGKPVD